jgi:hypothetical protein
MGDLESDWQEVPTTAPFPGAARTVAGFAPGHLDLDDIEVRVDDDLRLGPGAARWTQSLLEVARFELARADDKANTMFRFYGVVAALSIGLLGGQGWSPMELAAPAAALFWFGSASLLSSGWFLGTTLYPRDIRETSRDRLLYFGHVNQFASVPELRAALREVERDHDDRLVEQLLGMSHLVAKKYGLMRKALISLGLGAGACLVAVLGDALANAS